MPEFVPAPALIPVPGGKLIEEYGVKGKKYDIWLTEWNSVDFNPGSGTTTLPGLPGASAVQGGFLTKLNSTGALVWARGLASELQFPKERGKLPFAWEDGENDCVFFTFTDIPADLAQADLVITYNGKFPGKKHLAYYEDRLPVNRKSYLRNR